jgi:hypothetical protein
MDYEAAEKDILDWRYSRSLLDLPTILRLHFPESTPAEQGEGQIFPRQIKGDGDGGWTIRFDFLRQIDQGIDALRNKNPDALALDEYPSLESIEAVLLATESFLASRPQPEAKDARELAWVECRADREPVTGSDEWTVGEGSTYRGFFYSGWDAALATPAEGTTREGERIDILPCPICGKPAYGSMQMVYGCGDGNCDESLHGWSKPEWIEHCALAHEAQEDKP